MTVELEYIKIHELIILILYNNFEVFGECNVRIVLCTNSGQE